MKDFDVNQLNQSMSNLTAYHDFSEDRMVAYRVNKKSGSNRAVSLKED